jgi:hypothetical protein
MQKQAVEGMGVQRSLDSVFANLGLPDTEKLKIKTSLMFQFEKALRVLGLTRQAVPWHAGNLQKRTGLKKRLQSKWISK